MKGKNQFKNRGGKRLKIKYLLAIAALSICGNVPSINVNAESCPDLRIVFARGSGGTRWVTEDYLEFKSAIETKISSLDLSYEFIDLDYPAIAIGFEHIDVSLGAFFGAGDAYQFGDSVKDGVKKLDEMVNSSVCPNAKYVLGGYSQGAMTVSRALGSLNADKIIYAATFGDPKLYLPEGKGIIPPACKGENLSDYRMYVPDCQAYQGLLGSYIPYEPDVYAGKVGTWCNKGDIFCSSHFNISDHMNYVSDALYEDASRVIFDKITKYYGFENKISSPHDTAILIDSTGSMYDMIEQYKAEALRLAKQTLESGGRVALYDYRDLDDPYNPVKHCDFNTCTLEVFQSELEEIEIDGGGDTPESLLSASFHVMTDLEWKYGSTKSLVVLTDADFLSPDRDGMSLDEVVSLSKRIDPVNFYVITDSEYGEYYQDLAEATGGKVVTNFDELDLLTDYIMERYDSLPRVEENSNLSEAPTIEINQIEYKSNSEVFVSFKSSGEKVLVILNDKILGLTDQTAITIQELDNKEENRLVLIPIDGDVRGEGVLVELELEKGVDDNNKTVIPTMIIPKAPNTGRK